MSNACYILRVRSHSCLVNGNYGHYPENNGLFTFATSRHYCYLQRAIYRDQRHRSKASITFHPAGNEALSCSNTFLHANPTLHVGRYEVKNFLRKREFATRFENYYYFDSMWANAEEICPSPVDTKDTKCSQSTRVLRDRIVLEVFSFSSKLRSDVKRIEQVPQYPHSIPFY